MCPVSFRKADKKTHASKPLQVMFYWLLARYKIVGISFLLHTVINKNNSPDKSIYLFQQLSGLTKYDLSF